jgi:hypothetical protein
VTETVIDIPDLTIVIQVKILTGIHLDPEIEPSHSQRAAFCRDG